MSDSLPSIGQRLFLLIEKGLNAFFGERCNPLYHLGAIAFFLLWIVIFTGLYLYAFFETSVIHAYASVDALTHGQRYFGGVLRSLHRYASDALVLIVVLHLVRHFVFNRHRGYRWFSWVSGVALLWLTYAAGINGYMLPWDRLSQFVVTTITEWFDVLPVIGGAMTRNFISNANVSDRLFSLLSFMHIGLPLSMLALLWIHTQRVPDAKTSPPTALMVGVVTSLTALSLISPALSQAPADMATMVATLDFDWFYLPSFALIPLFGLKNTWFLLLCATLLMLALPWLSLRKPGKKKTWNQAVQPDDCIVAVRPDETLLDAGLREGLPMPYDCRNGGCGVCKCTLLQGEVSLLPFQNVALTAAERAAGKILLCCAKPKSDVEIRYLPLPGTKPLPVKQYTARVTVLELLAADVMRLCLRVEGGKPIQFHPGQYINILLDAETKRSFSFATAPHSSDEIELHVRLIEGGRFTSQVFSTMRVGDQLRFEGPVGAFALRENGTKPIIFVAGATGFAPVKSMLEYAFQRDLKRDMILYWGVRSRRDLYLGTLAEQWAREHQNFHFIPVLSEPRPEDDWTGRIGLVHEAILADFPDLSAYQVYACGSVQMVQTAYPAFVKHGIASDDCFSDAFHLSPQQPIDGDGAELIKLGGSHV